MQLVLGHAILRGWERKGKVTKACFKALEAEIKNVDVPVGAMTISMTAENENFVVANVKEAHVVKRF